MTSNLWQDYPVPPMRREAGFGDRIVPTFWPRPASVWQFFADSAARTPPAEALVCGDTRLTYADCDAAATRLCAGLAAHGIRAGERVLLFIDNRPEFVLMFLALQRLGAIAVPVGVHEQRPGLACIARQCGAAAIVIDADLVGHAPRGDEAHDLRLHIDVGGGEAGAPGTPGERCVVIVPAFKADSFIGLMAAERISHTMMVTAMYKLCMLQPAFAGADLSAWRIGSHGGAPMPEAAIIGKPCPVLGERVHAVVHVAPASAAASDDAALRAFCAARLADDKVPESVTWCSTTLPRNANGKLMKRPLRAQLAGA
jgi:acyl-CoA synthetase (AMP-forming)/AMP-acid ligase II